MDLLDQLLQIMMQGIGWIVNLVQTIWDWSVEQIRQVPWDSLGALPLWKQILLGLVAAGVLFMGFRAGKILFEAGEKLLDSISTLLGAFVKTLVPVLLAGVIATAGAWIINNVNF